MFWLLVLQIKFKSVLCKKGHDHTERDRDRTSPTTPLSLMPSSETLSSNLVVFLVGPCRNTELLYDETISDLFRVEQSTRPRSMSSIISQENSLFRAHTLSFHVSKRRVRALLNSADTESLFSLMDHIPGSVFISPNPFPTNTRIVQYAAGVVCGAVARCSVGECT